MAGKLKFTFYILDKFERIKEDKENMERLEGGVEDRARCLYQEYHHIKGGHVTTLPRQCFCDNAAATT